MLTLFYSFQSIISRNAKSGFVCDGSSEVALKACKIEKNGEYGICLREQSSSFVVRCHLTSNAYGSVQKDFGCTATVSGTASNL